MQKKATKHGLFEKNKKGQMGGAAMTIIFAFVALAVIGVIQLVGILIVAKVAPNVRDSLALDTLHTTNESIAVVINAGAANSTLFSNNGVISSTVVMRNRTSNNNIVQNTDYTIRAVNGDGIDDVLTRLNFTWINPAYNFSNTTGVFASYDTVEETAYHATTDALRANNLDSFELGGTGQIVYAASVVILAVFGIIVMFKRN